MCARGTVVVAVDLWTATRLEEVLRRIVAAVPSGWTWRERLQAQWVRLGLSLALLADARGEPSLTLNAAPDELGPERARELFLALLARLDGVAAEADHPVALVLDEFQRM